MLEDQQLDFDIDDDYKMKDLKFKKSFKNMPIDSSDEESSSSSSDEERSIEVYSDSSEDEEEESSVDSKGSLFNLIDQGKDFITINVMIQMEHCTGKTLREFLDD